VTVLVVGASGATGRLLVEQLLGCGHTVRIVVRGEHSLPPSITNHDSVSTIIANVLDLSDEEMATHVKGCGAVASCLGHRLSFRGIFGAPRRLVTDAMRRLCRAIRANDPEAPVRLVLMNTAGNSNRDLPEPISFGQQCVISLLRLLLPPHVDNEMAADFLRTDVGQTDNSIEWVAVRPDDLTDASEVTEYELHPSPIRSAIFNAGTTSRINVGHFMASLITNDDTWDKWKGQMPVIYNQEQA
jgi:NAD(P)-dependent dehydrogenase (short-subunit alcohol dehydrogenase family)